MDASFAAHLPRLTLLAQDIVEAILTNEGPSESSLTTLTKDIRLFWENQRMALACPTEEEAQLTGDTTG